LLRKDGVTVNCLHPGVVDTNLFENMNPLLRYISGLFMTSPRKGAETTVYLATSPDINGQTGRYFIKKKVKKPSRAALDDKSAEKLWDLSMKYIRS
jgi:short-subunit dehydrogenase